MIVIGIKIALVVVNALVLYTAIWAQEKVCPQKI